jgi:integrase
MRKRKLGQHLEWHGNRIRVVIRVPPSQVEKVGKTKLKQVLETTDHLEAEREKVDVILAMRARLAGEKSATVLVPLTQQALQWREAAREERLNPVHHDDQNTVAEALSDRVDQIEALHGRQAAQAFAAIATGTATPLRVFVDEWFEEKGYSAGYKLEVLRAIRDLEAWCASTATSPTIEAIKAAEAGTFCHAQYIRPKVHFNTANKYISCLHSYWKWLGKRRGFSKVNPWDDQRIDPPNHKHAVEGGDKRPFEDSEVLTLLNGIRTRRDFEFSLFAALSGLRVDEIAMLRVRNCEDGKIAVIASKTPSGKRTIPTHPMLSQLISRRSIGKSPNEYLFEELPEQKANSKRGRSAPVSQSFSRERTRLKVD